MTYVCLRFTTTQNISYSRILFRGFPQEAGATTGEEYFATIYCGPAAWSGATFTAYSQFGVILTDTDDGEYINIKPGDTNGCKAGAMYIAGFIYPTAS